MEFGVITGARRCHAATLFLTEMLGSSRFMIPALQNADYVLTDSWYCPVLSGTPGPRRRCWYAKSVLGMTTDANDDRAELPPVKRTLVIAL